MSRRCRRASQFRASKLNVALVAAAGSVVGGMLTASPASAQSTGNRLLGLDVSAWQGSISQTTWNNIRNVENRQFVFVRSSRGGTTGEDHRQGGYPNEGYDSTTFRLSQRYDDRYFIQNVNRATAAGMFVGSYHFSRPDVLATTLGSDGIPAGVDNSGTDEANHFLQMAGPFMRPGYLPPTHDFEAGDGVRTDEQMAQFCLDFSNRVYQVMGIRPAIYVNGNYAHNILGGATAASRAQLAQQPSVRPTMTTPAYGQLWSARWPNQTDPDSIPVQTDHPKTSFTNIYGPWDDYGITHPWAFWQYASTGRLQSYNNGGSNLDFDVAAGGLEFVKDQLIPALWWNDNSGDWSTLANWNSGQTPVLHPLQPGQLSRPDSTLPTPRLPGAAGSGPTSGQNDTVILERPTASITVTLSTGTHDIRKLYMREALNITGGTLNINYVPVVPESSAMSAQISGPMTLGGTGALSVHTMWIDATRSLTVSGGTLTFNTIDLKQAAALSAGSVVMTGNAIFAPLNNGTATITTSAGPGGAGASGALNLSGGNRAIAVGNGTADVDLQVNVPITNGQLTKSGLGTMALGATNSFSSGPVTLNDGILRVAAPGQLNGANSVVSNITVTTAGSAGAGHGGTLQLTGNNTYSLPMTINGGGLNGISVTAPGSMGALDSLSGASTWAGNITLAGTGTNGTDPTINQVSAQIGGTLVLSGVISNDVLPASLAKSGHGDVVLTGGSANTYSNLTRVYGGRLIIEKDQALGAPGSATLADGNTFQLGGLTNTSTIAFRAPVSSPGGFHYAAAEWINLDGVGNGVFGQLDNLGGDNTFSGHIGLNGPSGASILGVSAGSLQLAGGIYARGASGSRNITKTGSGTLILSGDSGPAPTNTLNGELLNSTLNISAGTVRLNGTAGNTANVPGITVYNVGPGTLALAKQGAAGGAAINITGGGVLRTDANLTHAGPLSVSGAGGALDSAGSTATFTGVLTGTGALAKNNLGVATLAGDLSGFAGPLNVSMGTLAVAPDGGPAATLGVASLSVNTVAAALDLADNDLIVNSGSFSQIQNLVLTGFGGSTGITSSTSDGSQILALFDNALLGNTHWNGHTVSANAIIGKYTYFGDANLDGQVTGDDYTVLDANLNTTPLPGIAWLSGDANMDGSVTGDDYTVLDANLGNGVGNPLTPTALPNGIPEPSMLTSLLLFGSGLLARRRRLT